MDALRQATEIEIDKAKNRIRIESGTISLGVIPKNKGNNQYINFTKPAQNAHYSIQISFQGQTAYWANLMISILSQQAEGFNIGWWNNFGVDIPEGNNINWTAIFYDD